jgi:hypothetical protein
MDINGTIEAFRKGTLDIDCRVMVLRQRKENGEVLQGAGYIRQKPDGTLNFKIYVASVINPRRHGMFDRLAEIKPGKLIHEEAFYDLSATTSGHTWTSERLLCNFKSDPDGKVTVAYDRIAGMRADVKLPFPNYETLESDEAEHFVDVYFFEEYDIPRNYQEESEFEFDGVTGHGRKEQELGQTVIKMESATPFPASFHLRIQEALQYITGKSATWAICVRGGRAATSMALSSPERKSANTRFPAPISTGSIDYHNHGWPLFWRYLTYVRDHTDETYWNAVAYHIHNARESTANSVDAGAIGVSVAMEAIASLLAGEYSKEEKNEIENLQRHVLDCVGKHPDLGKYAERLRGLMGGLATKGTKDVLHELAKKGAIEPSYIAAWSWLRNGKVHPKLKNLKRPDLVENQKMLTKTSRVEVLIHQLVFHLIGYQGPFTDYGVEAAEQRFPNKAYPLPVSENQEFLNA